MKRLLITLTLISILLLASCSPKTQESNKIRIAVLPVLDVLPVYIAEQQGYFEDAGLEIEFVNVNSAPERDQLMQAGQVDAILNELVSVILYNQNETSVSAVRFARTATESTPIFRILTAPGSGLTTVEDLKNIPIGVSEGTVIEYTTDRMLENAGLTGSEIEKIAVPKIPDRLALLLSGELLAGNLPDPVASLAMQSGANLVIDDTSYPEISTSVITFSTDFLEKNPNTVKKFLLAYEYAVRDINSDKTAWNDLLLEKALVPEPLIGKYELPSYPAASVPDESQFADALQWLLDKGLLENSPEYKNCVSAEYLPE